jgi:SAM-dependent methyltransferase
MPGDHFSQHASEYARHRPTYPVELYAWLAAQTTRRELAWDVGCGNGQATVALAEHYSKVVGTDISPQQIREARAADRVEYRVGDEGTSGLDPRTADLITAAQAAHWFDMDRFATECRRVAKPGGVVAIWGYGLTRLAPEIDVVVQRFFSEKVGPFWPSGREHLENEYRTLELPFEPITTPPFAMTMTWGLRDFTDYVGTWSAVQRYAKAKGEDPIPELFHSLSRLWGTDERVVTWPLYLKVGRVGK